MESVSRIPVHVTTYDPAAVSSGTAHAYVHRPMPSTVIPSPVTATGVPRPPSTAPDAAMLIVTPETPQERPEFMYVSNWTSKRVSPPGKTSLAAFDCVARVATAVS